MSGRKLGIRHAVILCVLLVSVGFTATVVARHRSHQRVVAWIKDQGGFYKRKMDWVGLGGTSVKDISPLRRLRHLRVLILDDTRVTDLSPLENLAELEMLSVKRTPITGREVSRFRKLRPECKVIGP